MSRRLSTAFAGAELGLVVMLFILASLACTSTATSTPPVSVRPTGIVILITATPAASAQATARADATPQPTPVATDVPSGGCALNMAYVADVTIQDGTTLSPGIAFLKTWRVKNSGTCEWKDGTQLVFADGEQMRGPAAVSVPPTAPNATADISVNLTAPTTPGKYAGRWRMRSPDGTIYGTLTVVIVIPATPTVTPGELVRTPTPAATPTALAELYNLHDKASTASWTSISGTLTFPGAPEDPRGAVLFRDNQKLDDGNTYVKILETHPAWVTGGFIQGIYTVGEIRSGDRFRARLGFLHGEGITEGNVTFIVKGGNGAVLGSFGDTRDGNVIVIDLDLTPIAGKTNQIILRVEANNPDATQDWACWVNPRVFGIR